MSHPLLGYDVLCVTLCSVLHSLVELVDSLCWPVSDEVTVLWLSCCIVDSLCWSVSDKVTVCGFFHPISVSS